MSASVHGVQRTLFTALTSKPQGFCLFVHLFVFKEKIKIPTQLGCSILYKRLMGHFKGWNDFSLQVSPLLTQLGVGMHGLNF